MDALEIVFVPKGIGKYLATDSGSGSPPAPEVRIANAMEFLAFRMGRIDQKLGRLVELLEKQRSGA